MYKYQEESFYSVVSDIQPLIVKHWEEIALHKDKRKLNPDFDIYKILYETGKLKIYTIRKDNNELVGYAIYIIEVSPHYKNNLRAENDLLYVKPEYRKGTVAIKLLKFAEKDLKNFGVHIIALRMKKEHAFKELAEFLKYSESEFVFEKYVGDSIWE